MFQQFNLSRIKSLRTLETTAESVTTAGDTVPGSLRTILSTVTSPMLLDLIIVYWDSDIDGVSRYPEARRNPEAELEYRAACALRHQHRFKVLREMHKAREFQLVLCADVFDHIVKCAMEMLERLVNAERVRGGWDYLLYEPSIIAERRSPRARYIDRRPGWEGRRPVSASAL